MLDPFIPQSEAQQIRSLRMENRMLGQLLHLWVNIACDQTNSPEVQAKGARVHSHLIKIGLHPMASLKSN